MSLQEDVRPNEREVPAVLFPPAPSGIFQDDTERALAEMHDAVQARYPSQLLHQESLDRADQHNSNINIHLQESVSPEHPGSSSQPSPPVTLPTGDKLFTFHKDGQRQSHTDTHDDSPESEAPGPNKGTAAPSSPGVQAAANVATEVSRPGTEYKPISYAAAFAYVEHEYTGQRLEALYNKRKQQTPTGGHRFFGDWYTAHAGTPPQEGSY